MIKQFYKILVPEKERLEIIYFIKNLKAPFYFGKHYYCICCNHSFSTFLPKGNITRYNAECAFCGSLERTRLLLLYLQKETNIFSNPTKLLHIAPERALKKIFRKYNNIYYIDGDINPAYASHKIDLTKIQYPDNSFDVVICAHVLGHIPNEVVAIQELYRVLKKGGYAILMTLISNNTSTLESNEIISDKDRLIHYGEPDLCRLHGQDFVSRMEKQNFKVEKIDYRLHYTEEERIRYSLGNGERELIFKCSKK